MYNCLATFYVPRHLPLQASPHMRLWAWRLDFCFYLLGIWGLCNSWVCLAVPIMSSPSWLSTALSVLCMATCIIHEGGLLSPRASCSFARIMDFDRTSCCAGLLVISVVIAISFLLIHDGPLQLLRGDAPVLTHRDKLGHCHCCHSPRNTAHVEPSFFSLPVFPFPCSLVSEPYPT